MPDKTTEKPSKSSMAPQPPTRARRWGLLVLVLAASAGLTFWALATGPARVFSQRVVTLQQPVLAGEALQVPVRVRWDGPGPLVIDKVESS